MHLHACMDILETHMDHVEYHIHKAFYLPENVAQAAEVSLSPPP